MVGLDKGDFLVLAFLVAAGVAAGAFALFFWFFM